MGEVPASFEIKTVEDDEKNINIETSKKRTIDYTTRYEYTMLIACRALQISFGKPPKVDIGDIKDPNEIAKMELHARVIPLIIVRTLPDGTKETWNVNKEMHIRDY